MGTKQQATGDNIHAYDGDADDEGCVRLYVNTDAPYSEEEVDRIGRKIEAVDDLAAALRGLLDFAFVVSVRTAPSEKWADPAWHADANKMRDAARAALRKAGIA